MFEDSYPYAHLLYFPDFFWISKQFHHAFFNIFHFTISSNWNHLANWTTSIEMMNILYASRIRKATKILALVKMENEINQTLILLKSMSKMLNASEAPANQVQFKYCMTNQIIQSITFRGVLKSWEIVDKSEFELWRRWS